LSGLLKDSPAAVVAQLLNDLGYGSVYVDGEPSEPDAVVTVYNTSGVLDGRTMVDGEVQEHHGLQIRVRDVDDATAHAKVDDVAIALDQRVYANVVEVGSDQYIVYCLNRKSSVTHLGTDKPTSRRTAYTVNYTAALRQVPSG
jgi:Bacteriophage minor capsid protein